MRTLLAALALCAIASPAAAQTREEDAVRALNNPLVQEGAAAMVGNLADILLDTRVGPLARLADPRDDIRATDTLRDLKRRDDPDFEKRLRADTRRAVAAIGTLSNDALEMRDEYGRTAERLRAALAPLAALLDDGAGGGDDN
jgi:hypothetical protein